MKVQFDAFDLELIQQVIDHPETRQSPWLETNLFCNYALYKALGVKVNNPKQLLKSPYVFHNNQKKSISVKSFSPDSTYPELKEYKEHRPFDLYLIAVFDSKRNIVWLDGWIDYETFIQDSNLYKGCYLMSYKDLNPMENLL